MIGKVEGIGGMVPVQHETWWCGVLRHGRTLSRYAIFVVAFWGGLLGAVLLINYVATTFEVVIAVLCAIALPASIYYALHMDDL